MRLEIRDLTVHRGERRVITGLNATLDAGGALIVRGANGAGKSTLLRALAGLVPVLRGAVRLGGAPPGDYAARLHFIGHRDGVKGALSVAENVAFWGALLEGRETARALEAFALGAFAGMPAAFLSAGQRRRLALSRLVAAPRLLWLLDEPAAGLDAPARETLYAAIAAHRAQGGLVVMASHGELALPDAQDLTLGRA